MANRTPTQRGSARAETAPLAPSAMERWPHRTANRRARSNPYARQGTRTSVFGAASTHHLTHGEPHERCLGRWLSGPVVSKSPLSTVRWLTAGGKKGTPNNGLRPRPAWSLPLRRCATGGSRACASLARALPERLRARSVFRDAAPHALSTSRCLQDHSCGCPETEVRYGARRSERRGGVGRLLTRVEGGRRVPRRGRHAWHCLDGGDGHLRRVHDARGELAPRTTQNQGGASARRGASKTTPMAAPKQRCGTNPGAADGEAGPPGPPPLPPQRKQDALGTANCRARGSKWPRGLQGRSPRGSSQPAFLFSAAFE